MREAEPRPFAHRVAQRAIPVPMPPSWPEELSLVARWPLRDFIELGALPGAVPSARSHCRQALWEWHLTGLARNAELLVSELITNAVAASRSAGSPAVRLWLLSDIARVLILVQDDSPQRPARTEPAADAESGRGLLIVEAISSRWNWYAPSPGGTGKVTWALLDPPGAQE